ncbi:MAG: hypothetical protein PSX71_12855 [bacterium]|nr:hypothetical protein [bacterium]
MTTYKRNLWAWVCFMSLGFLIILAGLYVWGGFAALLFVEVLGANFFFDRITCPNCETRVTFRAASPRLVLPWEIRNTFFPKKCQKCGWDLDKDL